MLRLRTFPQLILANLWLRFFRLCWHGVRIGRASWIKSQLNIGRGSGTGIGFVVRGSGVLSIGRYCAIGESVRVITSNHDMGDLSLNFLVQDRILGKRSIAHKRDVTIGNDVWIGDGAILLAGITVGDGAVIGAGAVVTHSVLPFKVVGGNPAMVIKDRFPPDIAARVQDLSWWNWTEAEQQERATLFEEFRRKASEQSCAASDASESQCP